RGPVPLGKWAPQAPPALVTLVERALAKDPAQRFRDAGELRAALGRARAMLSGARPVEPAPPPPAPLPASAEPQPTTPDPEATLAVEPPPPNQGTRALAAQPNGTPRPARSSPTLAAKAATHIEPSLARLRPRPAAHDHSRWRRLVPLVLVFGLVSGVGISYLAMHRLAPAPVPTPLPSSGPDVHA